MTLTKRSHRRSESWAMQGMSCQRSTLSVLPASCRMGSLWRLFSSSGLGFCRESSRSLRRTRPFRPWSGLLATSSSSLLSVRTYRKDLCFEHSWLTVWSPGLACFFSFMTIAEGGGRRALTRKFQDVYLPTLKANFILWPAIQVLNFRVIPIQFQIVSWLSSLCLFGDFLQSIY